MTSSLTMFRHFVFFNLSIKAEQNSTCNLKSHQLLLVIIHLFLTFNYQHNELI